MLQSAIRSSKPLAKKLVKSLAKEGMSSAGSAISDIISGVPVKDALKTNASLGLNRLRQGAIRGVKRKFANHLSHESSLLPIKKKKKPIKRVQKGYGVKRRKKRKSGKKVKKKKKKKTKGKRKKSLHSGVRRPYKGIFS